MARPNNFSALPEHPAVSKNYRIECKYGHQLTVCDVTCPKCGYVRTWSVATLRHQLKNKSFSGHCRSCCLELARTGLRKRQAQKNQRKLRTASNGYVIVSPFFVEEADLPLYRAMHSRGSSVMHHRFVMAKHLGRALLPNELVDHMDGDKTNNDISNLRLYIRGLNQPGSTSGYGTYYHEWQMAEARNRDLVRELEKLRHTPS